MSKTTDANFSKKIEDYCDDSLKDDIYDVLAGYCTHDTQVEKLVDMFRNAYKAGLRDAAQDSVDTLLQYGTVVAGLPKKDITPTELYDTAANALMVYFTRTLLE
jgi:hypothetical protein